MKFANLGHALTVASCSDTGIVRAHNEDAVFVDAELGVAILADGMGGYNAGEVASGMATTLLAASFTRLLPQCDDAMLAAAGGPAQLLADEVSAANAAIFNTSQSQAQCAGMGTTLVLAWFLGRRLYVGHVGDSRLYRLRGDDFQQLTKDHSLLQEQLDSGMISVEEARFSENKNLVTRALGVEPEVDVEVHEHDVQGGDIILLCSDGLNDMVDDEEIAEIIRRFGANPALAATLLVETANDNGGRDNTSVVLMKVAGNYAAPVRWWQKLLALLK
ncbi:MAG: Stp1/IreP family PP2C-type Ser/Thr phosphatase [Azonexus sp.]|nr:Stp1/IreP family PP2C-type Ser/Thr phosphatase [Azonexus sp.]